MLKSGERIDDLQYGGLRIIQNPDKYCFTSDSVLLANSVNVRKSDEVCDLCAGSGIVGILIAAKKNPSSVVLVELQRDMADMAQRSVKLNNMTHKISVVNDSVQNAPDTLGCETFDAVVVNPPYEKAGSGFKSADEAIYMCRTEVKLSLDELIYAASKILKFGGKFYMIHRADRMCETVYKLKRNNLEPKTLTLVYPKADKAPSTIIYECAKGGKEGVKIKSLVVMNDDNRYTDDAKKLYSIE